MLYMEKKPASGWVAPDDVCQLGHVCCCGDLDGQAAHKALTRYSSWSSRITNGCKQHQEQQSAAWAWHKLMSRVAQLYWRSSLLLSLTGTTICLTYHHYTIANTTHKLHWHASTRGHMHTPVALPHAFTRWCACAMGANTGPKQAVAHVFVPVMSVGNPSR